MIGEHRWEYQFDKRGYECVGLPIGGVESHHRCVGCGCFIGKLEMRNSGYQFGEDKYENERFLDYLARGKGYEPIEEGTYEEWKLKQNANRKS
jgi:hypothetical protein